MTSVQELASCPHCGVPLREFRLPDDAGYATAVHLACFNNDCRYYREGWAWMREQYAVNTSYRYHVDPVTGVASPLAVWSETALVDRILEK